MTVVSPEFGLLVLVTVLLHVVAPVRLQNWVLLVASYVFLLSWSVETALVFAGLTLGNFVLGKQLAPENSRRRWALWLGIALNVGALLYFKYTNFFLPDNAPDLLKIAFPIGLSFMVLQVISYLLDVQRGMIPPSNNLLTFAVYVAYFPKITSGPIERYRDLAPRLEENHRPTQSQVANGLTLFLQGLVRKIVLADILLLILPPDVFVTPQKYTAPELTIWLLVYAFALYNDFAGYTKLIRGVSSLLGIELTRNFSTPYFSRNFTEFWQRWHISLSNWLRDYIFMPVTRALLRRGYKSRHPLAVIIPPMVTMIVSGLWHGVNVHMVFWGGLHGFYQVTDRARSLVIGGKPAPKLPRWRQGLLMVGIFILAVLAWLPFTMELPLAFEYFKGLLNLPQWWQSGTIDWNYHLYWVFLILFTINFLLDLAEYKFGELAFVRLPVLAQAILINLAFFALFVALTTRNDTPPPFIYQGF